MSFEVDDKGNVIVRPQKVRTPDGTWLFYPKKGARGASRAPPPEDQDVQDVQDVQDAGGGTMDFGGDFSTQNTEGWGSYLDQYDVFNERRRRQQ